MKSKRKLHGMDLWIDSSTADNKGFRPPVVLPIVNNEILLCPGQTPDKRKMKFLR